MVAVRVGAVAGMRIVRMCAIALGAHSTGDQPGRVLPIPVQQINPIGFRLRRSTVGVGEMELVDYLIEGGHTGAAIGVEAAAGGERIQFVGTRCRAAGDDVTVLVLGDGQQPVHGLDLLGLEANRPHERSKENPRAMR
jgi:hypothetical protein